MTTTTTVTHEALRPGKVHFDEEHLAEVIEFEDDSESQQMREAYWEVFARDRCRFNDRISQTEEVLAPILQEEHRNKVYTKIVQSPIAKSANTASKIPNTNNLADSDNVKLNRSSDGNNIVVNSSTILSCVTK